MKIKKLTPDMLRKIIKEEKEKILLEEKSKLKKHRHVNKNKKTTALQNDVFAYQKLKTYQKQLKIKLAKANKAKRILESRIRKEIGD